jgi:hypothetical protein
MEREVENVLDDVFTVVRPAEAKVQRPVVSEEG